LKKFSLTFQKKFFQYRSKRDAAPSTDYYTTAPPEYKKEEYKQPASEYASPGYSPATNYQNYYNYEKTPNVRENLFKILNKNLFKNNCF